MTELADLWRLQETDIALDSRRASLEDAHARISDSEELIAARARYDGLLTAQRQAESAQRSIETEAADLRAKITPQETKLYSGAIKSPKELGDLQADIDQLKRHLSAVEDRDLEALAAAEAAGNEARTAGAEHEAIDAAWREEQAELAARVERLTSEIAVYDEQRRERAAYIDANLLKTYDRLRVAHAGRAMAKLDRNLCTGCRISLPTNLVNKARAGSALVQCPNCERILIT
ncbi:MAG: C4-type zinc ribbon domain-containing protein [Chloroflexota bacterium]|nr:C4-type zinc ribbon domain-containing protein [Chloroflexota bacterium]